MPKPPKNNQKPWTPADRAALKTLIKGNTPTGLLAHQLGRSKAAIYAQAGKMGVSVKPTNKSPYNRRVK